MHYHLHFHHQIQQKSGIILGQERKNEQKLANTESNSEKGRKKIDWIYQNTR
jgi:hypothetical protein